MSLLLFGDPFESPRHPYGRLLDRYFASLLNFDDFLPLETETRGHLRQRFQAPESDVRLNKEKFQACLDVQQFKPEELTVKVSDNVVTVEGKHEEKEDEHGFISRHFVRRYVIPEGHDLGKIESRLSSDGVLSITAPRITEGGQASRNIPVIRTGQPSQHVEYDKQEDKTEE
ncbi:heat shock protein 23 [Tribolium castaneum]|uniref:Heat shock protein 23-like Protein n=1 Tax=Tribolium castaneum TaxID=7070 RepID=D6WXQ7_TRICA|nr:PREDICTED: heat shock protein 23 [Tribolium castaneum]EFA07948.1 Heat shock protein 23-like Protein [Tribolium castaneum]|eukprot:XP_973344.1 PREDICTED: heat shock protein 23 [Tribolium castaneum]